MTPITLTITLDRDALVAALGLTAGSTAAPAAAPASAPTPAPATSPAPAPAATAGLERFDAAPSDWARWTFWDPSEFVPLQNRLVSRLGWEPAAAYTRINQQINAYASTIKLRGYHYPGTNNYGFYKLVSDGGAFTPDVNGAADAYVALHFPGALPLGPLR